MATVLELKRTRLANYYAAETAILSAQEYQIEGRRVRKADLQFVQSTIRQLEREISDLEISAASGSRLYTGVPR